jgi:Ca2+-binding EF-hand superfamily protein
LRQYIRGFCETEIGIEKIRQKILNEMKIKPEQAFRVLDRDGKGYLAIDDFREFLRL